MKELEDSEISSNENGRRLVRDVFARKAVSVQESDSQKTNNGIHYRLQLLYANGESLGQHLIPAGAF